VTAIYHNFIFIHIPKTGGRSIKNSIDGVTDLPGGAHKTLQELVDYGGDGVNNCQDNLPVVCFTRNPYDRLISAFYYRYYEEKFLYSMEAPESKLPGGGANGEDIYVSFPARPEERSRIRRPSITTFIEFMKDDARVAAAMKMTFFRTQHSYVSSEGSLKSQHIYKFENFENDFADFKQRFFPHEGRELLHLNKGPGRPDWRKFFKIKAIRKKVAELYKIDFETFGYSTEIL
tara:strand:+ start:10583 stop:11278 length:696 start_codon:yes stop_codon:yes gene_type:complete